VPVNDEGYVCAGRDISFFFKRCQAFEHAVRKTQAGFAGKQAATVIIDLQFGSGIKRCDLLLPAEKVIELYIAKAEFQV